MLLDQYVTSPEATPLFGGEIAPIARPQRGPTLYLHDGTSASRRPLESFISDRFHTRHAAVIREFMPLLAELKLGQDVSAVVGLRSGFDRPFFLESYLDQPIATSLSPLAITAVNNDKIVEIGNFAARNARAGSLLITLLAMALYQAGYQWMVFTATTEVEKMIAKLGCKQTVLTRAKQSKLIDAKSDWGSYYDNQPKVIACNLADTISKAQADPSLNRIFSSYRQQTQSLAIALVEQAAASDSK